MQKPSAFDVRFVMYIYLTSDNTSTLVNVTETYSRSNVILPLSSICFFLCRRRFCIFFFYFNSVLVEANERKSRQCQRTNKRDIKSATTKKKRNETKQKKNYSYNNTIGAKVTIVSFE